MFSIESRRFEAVLRANSRAQNVSVHGRRAQNWQAANCHAVSTSDPEPSSAYSPRDTLNSRHCACLASRMLRSEARPRAGAKSSGCPDLNLSNFVPVRKFASAEGVSAPIGCANSATVSGAPHDVGRAVLDAGARSPVCDAGSGHRIIMWCSTNKPLSVATRTAPTSAQHVCKANEFSRHLRCRRNSCDLPVVEPVVPGMNQIETT